MFSICAESKLNYLLDFVELNKANNTLTFFDNGIGMSKEEAIAHLGRLIERLGYTEILISNII